MFLFKVEMDSQLKQIMQRKFSSEAELQRICEENLNTIFQLQFVRSEFPLHNFRIDTVAFDSASKAFVLIEYKRDKNFSVVDQGFAYLSLMLNNKADFILEYNENCNLNLKRTDVDWSQSRVYFVSPAFTAYQKQSINFKDLPIELWEVNFFDNREILFIPQRPVGATESIKTVSKQSVDIEKVSRELKVYTEDDHTSRTSNEVKILYEKLRDLILGIDNSVTMKPAKYWVGFASGKKNFCDIVLQKRALKLYLNLKWGEIDDPAKLGRNVSKVGHWGNGDYEFELTTSSNFAYISNLIEQSFAKLST